MTKIKSILNHIKSFIFAHKVWSVIILLVLIFIGYKVFGNKQATEVRYVTGQVVKGTIVASVSGSGQVEASSSIDLKSKISGTITSVNAKAGSFVKKGQTLFSVDAQDAGKALRDAELNLQIATNDLENSKKDYENTKASKELSLKNLFLALNSSVVATPDNNNASTNIITLSGSYTSTEQGRYTLEIFSCKIGFCANYSGLESGSFPIITNVSQALGSRGIYVTFTSSPKLSEKWYIDVPSLSSPAYASNLKAYEEGKQTIPHDIESAMTTVKSRELALVQKKNAVIDARQTLSNYYVTAPFDGTIANITGKLGDTASGTLGTIITKQKIATITLNEVDVSKISLGQKTALTFDAIDGLSIAGEVVEIDGVGTVTSGVVSYKVKISFDTDDVRIKPGMSVSASIITSVAQDVLTVPSSAVKTKNGTTYIEVFDKELIAPVAGVQGSRSPVLPKQQTVETGISNDTTTEIKSGLIEGNIIVTKKITSAVATSTSSAPSLLGSGRSSSGGGAVRSATGR